MSLRALWVISHEKGENASVRFSRYILKRLLHLCCFQDTTARTEHSSAQIV